MLRFVADDFLEINYDAVQSIQRSSDPVQISVASGRSFEVQALLTLQRSVKLSACHLVFYCTLFKRALVYTIDETADAEALLRYGADCLQALGFKLNPVDLNLQPAMRESMLRDIPPLQTSEHVRRIRKERQDRIANLEKTLKMLGKPAPSTKEGLEHKKTTEQLNSERKTEEHLLSLREHFDKQFSALAKTLKPLLERQVPPPPAEEVKVRQTPATTASPVTPQPAQSSAGENEKLSRQQPVASAAAHRVGGASSKQAEAKPAESKKVEKVELENRINFEKQAREELAATRKELASAREELARAQDGLGTATGDLTVTRQELAATRKELNGLRKQFDARDEELAEVKFAAKGLEEQLKAAESQRLEAAQQQQSLEVEFEKLRAEATEVKAERQRLDVQLNQYREELESLRSEKDSLAKEASSSAARLAKLESDLPLLRGKLQQFRDRHESLTRENALLVEELAATREQLVAQMMVAPPPLAQGDSKAAEQIRNSARLITELKKQLAAAGQQLQELAEAKDSLAAGYAQERQKTQTLQDELEQAKTVPAAVATAKPAREQKPPNLLRRPPLPGAFFHVDWDLETIPCTVGAVSQVWRSIYNVTLSIEGYPHQYVGALIVLLKKRAGNRLFVLLRLEKEGRNLVYRPAKPIESDTALQKGLNEAQKFLRVSGVEIESVETGQFAEILKPYLLQD